MGFCASIDNAIPMIKFYLCVFICHACSLLFNISHENLFLYCYSVFSIHFWYFTWTSISNFISLHFDSNSKTKLIWIFNEPLNIMKQQKLEIHPLWKVLSSGFEGPHSANFLFAPFLSRVHLLFVVGCSSTLWRLDWEVIWDQKA